MSALSIDFAPAAPRIEREHLAEVIQLPVRRQPDERPAAVVRAAQPMRLTARGKTMLRVVASIIALAASIGIGAALGVAQSVPAGDVAVVVVEPGQSLWGIASAHAAPGEDVRELVAEIVSLNALAESTITAGQKLSVPSR